MEEKSMEKILSFPEIRSLLKMGGERRVRLSHRYKMHSTLFSTTQPNSTNPELGISNQTLYKNIIFKMRKTKISYIMLFRIIYFCAKYIFIYSLINCIYIYIYCIYTYINVHFCFFISELNFWFQITASDNRGGIDSMIDRMTDRLTC